MKILRQNQCAKKKKGKKKKKKKEMSQNIVLCHACISIAQEFVFSRSASIFSASRIPLQTQKTSVSHSERILCKFSKEAGSDVNNNVSVRKFIFPHVTEVLILQ